MTILDRRFFLKKFGQLGIFILSCSVCVALAAAEEVPPETDLTKSIDQQVGDGSEFDPYAGARAEDACNKILPGKPTEVDKLVLAASCCRQMRERTESCCSTNAL